VPFASALMKTRVSETAYNKIRWDRRSAEEVVELCRLTPQASLQARFSPLVPVKQDPDAPEPFLAGLQVYEKDLGLCFDLLKSMLEVFQTYSLGYSPCIELRRRHCGVFGLSCDDFGRCRSDRDDEGSKDSKSAELHVE
jgi:hypothetical protein